jgi:hypothetical protein
MYVHLALNKKRFNELLVHEGIVVVVQTFIEVPIKPKGMILFNTFIVKIILYFIVRTLK